MPTISLCMIVRDEAAVLERCLQSVAHLVDEIIIVDTGSVDETKTIAAAFTPHLYEFPWQDDFSAARNFAFSKGTGDYLFWMDADDVLPPESQQQFLERKPYFQADMIVMPYYAALDGQNQPLFTFERERLMRRTANYQWEGAVHEVIPIRETVQREEIPIWHKKQKPRDADRNLQIYQKQIAAGIPFSPREQYYYARELMEHAAYQAAISAFSKFLADGGGWSVDCATACLCRADCYQQLQQPEAALQSVFQSFQYATPRADACYRIGQYLSAHQQLESAVFWFQLALECGKRPQVGFCQPIYLEELPLTALCQCLLALGKTEEAKPYLKKKELLEKQKGGTLYGML